MITTPACITKHMPHKIIHSIPMHKIPYTVAYAYNPTDVAAHALRGNANAHSWLRWNIEKDGSFIHAYEPPYYNLKSPWTSAVSQALATLAFIQEGRIDLAEKAIGFMLDKHTSCGIIYEKGGVLILNGWLYGLYAMNKLYDVKPSGWLIKSIQNCSSKLTALFPEYVMSNGWSRYDETGIPATEFYHHVHKELLMKLGFDDEFDMIKYAKFPMISRNFHLLAKHGYKLPYIFWRRNKWLR